MSVETEQFVKLLSALSVGNCSAVLWAESAVTHYASPLVESCRVHLVRHSLALGDWDLAAPPTSMLQLASTLQNNLDLRTESDA